MSIYQILKPLKRRRFKVGTYQAIQPTLKISIPTIIALSPSTTSTASKMCAINTEKTQLLVVQTNIRSICVFLDGYELAAERLVSGWSQCGMNIK